MSILITLALVVGGFWLLIKALPILGRFLLYCVIAIPAWIFFLFFVPGFLDEGVVLLFLLVMAIARSEGSGFSISNMFGSRSAGSYYSDSEYSGGSSYSGSYVLNKKTGVIHDRWDPSVDTISDHHQRAITSSEAWELVGRGTRYRFKKDS